MKNIKKILKFIFKLFFKIYKYICVTIVTFLIIWLPYVYVSQFYECALLPNDTYLCPVGFLNYDIQLLDNKGNVLVASDIDDITFNNEYVYGTRFLVDKSKIIDIQDYVNYRTYFVYKKGWDKALESKDFSINTEQVRIMRMELNDMSTSDTIVKDKSYFELVKDPKYTSDK